MPMEDVLIPLIIRLDTGFIVFLVTVLLNVQNDVQLFKKALKLSATVPAKICLGRKDLMLVMDVPVHRGFSDKDFRDALATLELVLGECFWQLKSIAREIYKNNSTREGSKDEFHWPKGLLCKN